MTTPVSLTDEVTWINECYAYDENTHEHVAVYLIREQDRYILVDSGSFYHRDDIMKAVHDTTGGKGPDVIVLSHSDYPHSANVETFQNTWTDVDLVASSGSPTQQGLPENARKATIGQSMDITGRQFSFIDPPLADRSHTTWIFDHGADVLFTADGFGNVHSPADCSATSDDLDGGIDSENIMRHARETLVWLRYVDPEKLRDRLTNILNEYDPAWIAPVHGNPIAPGDVDDHLKKLITAAERISDEYDVPAI